MAQKRDYLVGLALVTLVLAGCNGKTSSAGVSGTPSGNSNATNTAQSPSTGKIAFESNRDGNFEIYTMNVDGTGLTRLTQNPARDHVAAWSPDGRKIAFASDRSGGGDIYVMNADGTGVTRLTTSPAIDANAAWSPDGASIAFNSTRDGDPNIYVMKSDGSDQQRVTRGAGGDVYPAWGPENKSRGVPPTGGATSTSSSTSIRLDSHSTRSLTSNLSPPERTIARPTGLRTAASSSLRATTTASTTTTSSYRDPASIKRSDASPTIQGLTRTRHGHPRETRSRSRAHAAGTRTST